MNTFLKELTMLIERLGRERGFGAIVTCDEIIRLYNKHVEEIKEDMTNPEDSRFKPPTDIPDKRIKTLLYLSRKGKVRAHVVGIAGCFEIESRYLGTDFSTDFKCYGYIAKYYIGNWIESIHVNNVLLATDQQIH